MSADVASKYLSSLPSSIHNTLWPGVPQVHCMKNHIPFCILNLIQISLILNSVGFVFEKYNNQLNPRIPLHVLRIALTSLIPL